MFRYRLLSHIKIICFKVSDHIDLASEWQVLGELFDGQSLSHTQSINASRQYSQMSRGLGGASLLKNIGLGQRTQ